MDDAYTLQVHNRVTHREIDDGTSLIPGGPKKRPELCVTITARILSFGTFVDQCALLLTYKFQ